MEPVVKELKFPSHEKIYFRDITNELNDAISESQTEHGRMLVESMHTTLGLVVTERDEPNLLKDYVEWLLRLVPEDKRSTWRNDKRFIARFGRFLSFKRYRHQCKDSPHLKPGDVDNDYNAGRHIRASMFPSSIDRSYTNGRLNLGQFQGLAIVELDGRDGSNGNPERLRTVVATMYPSPVPRMLPTGRLK